MGPGLSNTPSQTEWESWQISSPESSGQANVGFTTFQTNQAEPALAQTPNTPDVSPERHEDMPRQGEQMGCVQSLGRLHQKKPFGHHQIHSSFLASFCTGALTSVLAFARLFCWPETCLLWYALDESVMRLIALLVRSEWTVEAGPRVTRT